MGGDMPSVPIDRQSSHVNGNAASSSQDRGTAQEHAGQRNNKSTTLGDGTSGQYTGGKGTYGGKATQGSGSGRTSSDSNAKSNTGAGTNDSNAKSNTGAGTNDSNAKSNTGAGTNDSNAKSNTGAGTNDK